MNTAGGGHKSHHPDLADLLLIYLEMLKVEYIFGVPGGAIEPLYNALARSTRRGSIRPIVARHENGAAFMADGYARESGKLGVCCATTGPGTTNLITGMSSAYVDHIPVLAITAQTMLPTFGRGAFQESSYDAVDTVGMMEYCSRYSSAVTHPAQFEVKLTTALMTALRDPQGPVHLSIPVDVFRMPAPSTPSFPNFELFFKITPPLVDNEALEQLCGYMLNARKVVIMVGRRACSARKAILKFAELTNAAIVTTPQGKTCIQSYHPQNFGVFGFAGHKSAFQVMLDPEVDLVIACGSDFREWSTNGWDTDTVMNNKLVVVDISHESFQRTPMAKLHVCGDISAIFTSMLTHGETVFNKSGMACPATWLEEDNHEKNKSEKEIYFPDRRGPERYRCSPRHIYVDKVEKFRRSENEIPPIKPQRLMCELNHRFPPETRFLADTGNSFSWSTHYLFRGHLGAYRVAMGFASMGWAIGAAVGTALATPGRPVVAITGDGSFLMSGLELTVAVELQLPVIYVILNDNALGMVMHGQKLTGAEQIAHDLPKVDFAALARSVGAQGFKIEKVDDFAQIDYMQICTGNAPVVLDVMIDRDEVPPMGMRARMLSENGSDTSSVIPA